MRMLISVAMAGAIFAAAPALAQNAAAPDNTTDANATAANVINTMPANEVSALGDQNAAVPAPMPTTAQTSSHTTTTNGSFPWGVLGLLGLVGLFGRKRSS
jgi:hypothetical protein